MEEITQFLPQINGILKRLGEGTYRLKENYSNTMCEPCLGHHSNEPTVENI